MTLWLAYALGSVSVLVEWRAYLLHCGASFRKWSAIGAILWAAMYALLGAWTSALTMGSTALRTWLSVGLLTKQHKHLIAMAFVLLFTGLTVVSWQGLLSLLPAFAVINSTLALFYFDNRKMRIVMLASSVAWIINDILWQAWPALLAEVVAAGLSVRTIRQLYKLGKN